jgi:hypothetical protein
MKVGLWIGMLVILVALVCISALFRTSQTAQAGSGAPALQADSAQSSTAQSETYEGMLTDAHCGAQHSAAAGMSASNCVQVCVHGGEHFALVDGEKMYSLEGQEAALKRLAGERVKIVGALNGATLSVTSVSAP